MFRLERYLHHCSSCGNILKCPGKPFTEEAESCNYFVRRNSFRCLSCMRWMEECRNTGKIPCRPLVDTDAVPFKKLEIGGGR